MDTTLSLSRREVEQKRSRRRGTILSVEANRQATTSALVSPARTVAQAKAAMVMTSAGSSFGPLFQEPIGFHFLPEPHIIVLVWWHLSSQADRPNKAMVIALEHGKECTVLINKDR